MYIGVINPTAIIGLYKIANTGTEIIPPPKPEYPCTIPAIVIMVTDMIRLFKFTS